LERSYRSEPAKVERFAQAFPLLLFDADCAESAAEVRRDLDSRGQRIGPYDTLIAGSALANGLIVVTHNVGEFGRVTGLTIEDWQAGV